MRILHLLFGAKSIVILASMMVLISSSVTSNPINLTHFTPSQKLPGTSIECIYQDKIGIMWLGIESVGLSKFDGKSHTLYTKQSDSIKSMSSKYPMAIAEDLEGNIWTTTLNGLNKLDRKTEMVTKFFFSESNPNSLSSNNLRGICLDSLGFLWVATANGISIVNPQRNEITRLLFNANTKSTTENILFTEFHIDDNNNIWFGSRRHGLYMVEAKNYYPLLLQWKRKSIAEIDLKIDSIHHWMINTTPEDLNGVNTIRSINSYTPDTIWIGTAIGLYHFQPATEKFTSHIIQQPANQIINRSSINNLVIDGKKNLWVSSTNEGVAILNRQGEFESFLTKSKLIGQLATNSIRDIYQDQSGLVWLGTKSMGLYYLDPMKQSFSMIKEISDDQTNYYDELITCAFEDSYKNIWIGTMTDGLKKYDAKTKSYSSFTPQNIKEKSNNFKRINHITGDLNGNLWIATLSGIECVSLINKKSTHYLEGYINYIYHSDDNNLWIVRDYGLEKFNLKTKKIIEQKSKHVDLFKRNSDIKFSIIYKDSKGILWFGTESRGLFEYNENTDELKHHLNNPQNSNSIGGDFIRVITEDENGQLWIGTKSGGLNKYNRETGTFTQLSTINKGLPTSVYCLLNDSNNCLWLGSDDGITKYDYIANKVINFDSNNGLQNPISTLDIAIKNTDGTFLIGGQNGIYIFNPNAIGVSNYHATLIITHFESSNKLIDNDIYQNKSYTLNRNNTNIAFKFALLDYTAPDENTYEYKLENFDKDWVKSDNRNYANYTNLEPGTYTFKLKSANYVGKIGRNDLAITFEITAPFWKKWWFTPVLMISIIISIVLFYFFRIAIIRRRELHLQNTVKERTKALSEANRNLETSKREIEETNIELRSQKNQISNQNEELENIRKNLEKIVEVRTKDFEAAKIKAEESDRLKSAFLANMSHEIRTPLNAIMGFIDILKLSNYEVEERDKISSMIQSNSESLLQLINDIIDLSMIEANQIKIYKSTFLVNQFLSTIKDDYVSTNKILVEHNIKLILEIPDNQIDLEIFTAPERLKQILKNLINNAIKFTSNGSIVFGYKPLEIGDKKITFFVEDSGIGISENNLKIIFDRFIKIETQKSVFRGTGLGLSICKNLCELLGGNIWAESTVDKGSTFYFSIPIEYLPIKATL